MDKKTALAILDLDAAVSFEDAKKAYRNLAKKHHPDVAGQTPRQKRITEARMKDINLAFRYLAPLLKSNESVKTTAAASANKHEKDAAFSFPSKILEILSTLFHKTNHDKTFKNEPKQGKPARKSKTKKVHFDDIFKRIHEDHPDDEKKPYFPKTSAYRGYQNYMTLKRKMTSGRSRRHQNMSIERVNKIDPVRPVSPVR